jgi:hypothetical protein
VILAHLFKKRSFVSFALDFFWLQNGTNLSQKSHSLNQSHYEVWALITLKEMVDLGTKKIHTMPPC